MIQTLIKNAVDEVLEGVVLYEGETSSNNIVELSDSILNYHKITFIFKIETSSTDYLFESHHTDLKVDDVFLCSTNRLGSENYDLYSEKLTVTATTKVAFNVSTNYSFQNGTWADNSGVKLVKIIGYKDNITISDSAVA